TISQNNNQAVENYVFYAFSAVASLNTCTHYKEIIKLTKNSVLHVFYNKMPKFAKTRHLTPVLHFSQKCAKYARFAENEKICENAVLQAILAKCLKCVLNGCFCFLLKQLQIITISQNNNQAMENYVFYAFSAVASLNTCTHYKEIIKLTKNSVLHVFYNKMPKFAKTRHLTPVLHFSQKCAKYARFAENEKMCENAVL
ncbi:hypothetical protein PRA63_26065, partial [Klebsiella pneumoniae]|uniref:hypothetical protein n=1 Tax=Klebsiella pneumoniae TaxID=573 RepID=UPI002E80FF2F